MFNYRSNTMFFGPSSVKNKSSNDLLFWIFCLEFELFWTKEGRIPSSRGFGELICPVREYSSVFNLAIGRMWLRIGLSVGPHDATMPTWTTMRFQIDRPVSKTMHCFIIVYILKLWYTYEWDLRHKFRRMQQYTGIPSPHWRLQTCSWSDKLLPSFWLQINGGL